MKNLLYLALISAVIASCDKDSDVTDVELSVIADQTIIYAGDEVTYTVYHNCEKITCYSGLDGADYLYSYDYACSNSLSTDSDLYRYEDPSAATYYCDIDNLPLGNPKGSIKLYEQDSGSDYTNYIAGSYYTYTQKETTDYVTAKIQKDPLYDDYVLMWDNNEVTACGQVYARIYPKMPIGSDKTLTLRMRTETPYAQYFDGSKVVNYGETDPDDNYLYINVQLFCQTKDGRMVNEYSDFVAAIPGKVNNRWLESPNGNPNGNKTIVYTPSTEYQDVECDLSQIFTNWCASNDVDEEEVDELVYIQFNFKQNYSRSFYDKIYISDIRYSNVSVMDFSEGTTLPISNPSGVYTHKVMYEEPGTYEATFVGVNYSYKANYDTDFADEVFSNYNQSKKVVKVPVIVRKAE